MRRSESVDLDRVLRDSLLDKELRNLQALITLQLDDLAGLLIINESTVASEFLTMVYRQSCATLQRRPMGAQTVESQPRTHFLECLQEFLEIILWTGSQQESRFVKIEQGRTFGEALQCCEGLAAVPLLDTNVDVV